MKKRIMGCMMCGLLLTACGNSDERQAERLLEETRALCEQGELEAARAGIDSLRKNYPNMVDIRKAALRLHQDVELKIAQRDMTLTDSLLQQAEQELAEQQKQVDEHKAALKATPEELTTLTRMRMKRDSIRTQFETLGAKIRYIHMKQKE